MPGKRSFDVDVERRIDEVFTLLLRGASRPEILRHLAETGVQADRTADWYIGKANARFKSLSRTKQEQELGRQLGRLEDLYGRNFRVQDYKAALAVLRERNELLGLYPVRTQKHELSGPDGSAILLRHERALDDAELVARLRDELDARAAAPALAAPHPEPPATD